MRVMAIATDGNRRCVRVVLAASCPPPIAGQSVATAMLVAHLSTVGAHYRVIDIGKRLTTSWLGLCRRALEAVTWPARLLWLGRRVGPRPVFYLQLGQSPRALLRDIPLLGAAVASRWPIVVHVHGGAFRHAFGSSLPVIRSVLRFLLSRVSRAVVLTPRLASMFDGIVEEDRIRVISNGVEGELEHDARAHSRVRSGVTTVLFLSNLIESKGYVTFLECARLAKLRGRLYLFVLAGAKTGRRAIDPIEFARMHSLDNVEYGGEVDLRRKCELLRTGDVFVLPTKYPVEGQPLAILEAMHYGLPVITTNAGGIPDVIRDGENGYIVPADQAEVLLDRIDRLAGDRELYTRMSFANRDAARKKYSASLHVEALTCLFEEVRG